MSFGSPWMLSSLAVVPLAIALYLLAERRRMRYAVRYTNVDLVASLAGGRSRMRLVPPVILLLAVATLCVASARPRVHALIANDRATIILVLDVSGSMEANDVRPTRLAAAQQAIHTFLDRVPKRVRVGLVLFAGVPEEATPPTTDHALVAQAVDEASIVQGGFGGTAIGDALAEAVKVGLASAGVRDARALTVDQAASRGPASTLVSILFLSDGHQNRGTLQPLEGAAIARRAGIPVFTVALGTPGRAITNFNFGSGGNGGAFGGPGLRQALAPDPRTLHAIADATGGEFFPAKTAGAVHDAYTKLGSSLGRVPGRSEVTVDFTLGAAALLLLAGVLAALRAPRLP
ncbi:MAG: VWA domain-containing protein [Acidobacteriota bacterium]|nr:VWA domain-containing protein [Acidobacteriota bacterium]